MRTIIKILILIVTFATPSIELWGRNKLAVLVGISDYGNPRKDSDKWRNIHGAEDVALLVPLLEKKGFKVTTLTNNKATHANIIKVLGDITRICHAGDIVYLHFSMHGQPFEDINGDEADGWDEALVPVDAQKKYVKGVYEGQNHLIDDFLGKIFNKIRNNLGNNGYLYVTIDACHSGTECRGDEDFVRGTKKGFSQSGKVYNPDRSRETKDYFKISSKDNQSPIVILEACQSYQANKEIRIGTKWYGSLSYYISKAIARHSIDTKGVASNWIQYVKTSMANDKRLRRQNMVIEFSK